MHTCRQKRIIERMRLWLIVAMLVVVVCCAPTNAAMPESQPRLPPAAAKQVDFVRDIQPLFEKHCYSCHGEKKQESSLRLDDADLSLKGGDLGPAYVPGDSGASALVQYIGGTDDSI